MSRRAMRACSVWGIVLAGVFWTSPTAHAAESSQSARPTPPAMTAAAMRAFLARPLVARLATVRKNGSPQVVPMWFLYDDGIMYMTTRTHAAKVKHIRANPKVAVVVDIMEAPLKNKAVELEGTAELLTTGGKEMAAKIYRKYMGAAAANSSAAQRNINTPRVIIKITPTRVWSMDTTGS